MIKDNKSAKGITLIALIITIIVLLILAGVALAMVVGDNGIIAKAQTAKNNTEEAQNTESEKISKLEQDAENVLNSIRSVPQDKNFTLVADLSSMSQNRRQTITAQFEAEKDQIYYLVGTYIYTSGSYNGDNWSITSKEFGTNTTLYTMEITPEVTMLNDSTTPTGVIKIKSNSSGTININITTTVPATQPLSDLLILKVYK